MKQQRQGKYCALGRGESVKQSVKNSVILPVLSSPEQNKLFQNGMDGLKKNNSKTNQNKKISFFVLLV